jgi:cytochrome P450
MVLAEFSAHRVRSMRQDVQKIVDRCIDRVLTAERPVDLVQTLAMPLPASVISTLLGTLPQDHAAFDRRADVIVNPRSTPRQRTEAMDWLGEHFDRLVTANEAAPGDNLLGRLIVKNRQTGTLTHDDMVKIARMILFAGHITTGDMISLAIACLLEHPDQLAELKAAPELLPAAVEELLRYFSVGDLAMSRVAAADIELDGETIPAGDGIVVSSLAANWDEAAFTDPARLDFHRPNQHHLAFGHGIHQCLGRELARLQIEVALKTLLDRIPGLRLAVPSDKLPYKTDAAIYGLYALPVTW